MNFILLVHHQHAANMLPAKLQDLLGLGILIGFLVDPGCLLGIVGAYFYSLLSIHTWVDAIIILSAVTEGSVGLIPR